jgi:hypothetical protein
VGTICGNIGSHLDITSGLRGHQGRRTVRILGALQRLLKTGGRLAKHARYHWLTHAKSHVTLRRFWGIRPKKSRRDRTDDLDRVVSSFRGNFCVGRDLRVAGQDFSPDSPPDYRLHGISPP